MSTVNPLLCYPGDFIPNTFDPGGEVLMETGGLI